MAGAIQLGGSDPTITIPSVRISLADGNTFKNALRFRSRTSSGVLVNMILNLAVYAGADPLGRVLVYTPNPFQGGSSVSHWDPTATPTCCWSRGSTPTCRTPSLRRRT
jgi:hypothetical protein